MDENRDLVKSLRALARTLKTMDMPNYAKVCRDAARIIANQTEPAPSRLSETDLARLDMY